MGSLEGNEGYGRADYFLVGKDFPSYIECQVKVDEAYRDQKVSQFLFVKRTKNYKILFLFKGQSQIYAAEHESIIEMVPIQNSRILLFVQKKIIKNYMDNVIEYLGPSFPQILDKVSTMPPQFTLPL